MKEDTSPPSVRYGLAGGFSFLGCRVLKKLKISSAGSARKSVPNTYRVKDNRRFLWKT